MITVVEFRAKQATGSKYMPTGKLYANYFFIKIYLGWLELAKNWTQFQKIECPKKENNQNVLLIKVLLSSKKKKIRQIRLIFYIKDFENQIFATFLAKPMPMKTFLVYNLSVSI